MDDKKKREVRDGLNYILEEMVKAGRVEHYKIDFNSITQSFDVSFRLKSGFCRSYKNLLSPEDLSERIKYNVINHRSYICKLCTYYHPESGGCKLARTCVDCVGCKEFRYGEIPPTDTLLYSALMRVKEQYRNNMQKEIKMHKTTDDLLLDILEKSGYEKGVARIRAVEKGYLKHPAECEHIKHNDMINWQCYICRYRSNLPSLDCQKNLQDWPAPNNECNGFSIQELPIDPYVFNYILEVMLDECNECEVNPETLHYNIDKIILYTLKSLGFTKTAKEYEAMEKHYIKPPF